MADLSRARKINYIGMKGTVSAIHTQFKDSGASDMAPEVSCERIVDSLRSSCSRYKVQIDEGQESSGSIIAEDLSSEANWCDTASPT